MLQTLTQAHLPASTLLEDRVRALEKGNLLTPSTAAVDEGLIQRTEETIFMAEGCSARAMMTNQILPQALRSYVEPRIREIAIAHEQAGNRVGKLTDVADRHSALLQESSESMGHITEMIRTSASAQDDMKKMMGTLLSMTGSNKRQKKKSSSSKDSSPQEAVEAVTTLRR